jgi:hypothetical protein
MELLLNLVWVFVAATVLYAWGRRRNHPQARPQLVVLLCLLALLFPVISATDDLHAMNSEMEDSTSVRRSTKQVIAGKSVGQFVYHAPTLAVSDFNAVPPVYAGAVTNLEESAGATTLPFTTINDRAPPQSILS